MCVPGLFPPAVMSSYFLQNEKKGYAALYLARPQSCLSYLLHGEKGVVCNICLYLAFPVMSFYFLQGDKGGFSSYVCTWLSLCHVFLLIAR